MTSTSSPSSSGRYELLQCIGRGSYGDVFEGVDTTTGKHVAIKIIYMEQLQDDIDDIYKEISMLAACKSPHITEYYGSELQPGSSELMIIMELLDCSVADLLHSAVETSSPLDEACIAFILQGVLRALAYLHDEKRVHRDVKAANVLLSASGSVKISDLGVAGQLSGTMNYRKNTFVGTPLWMAPEVIVNSEGYTEKADIWSVGITAIEMAMGSPPHSHLPPMKALFAIPKEPAPRLQGDYSDSFKDFVVACLCKEADARPAVKDLLQHPFIADASLPEALPHFVSEYCKRRPPVPSRKALAGMDDGTGTLPAWDFNNPRSEATPREVVGTLRAAAYSNVKLTETVQSSAANRSSAQTLHTRTIRSAQTDLADAKAAAVAAGSNTKPLSSSQPPSGTIARGSGQSLPQPQQVVEQEEERFGTVNFLAAGPVNDRYRTVQSRYSHDSPDISKGDNGTIGPRPGRSEAQFKPAAGPSSQHTGIADNSESGAVLHRLLLPSFQAAAVGQEQLVVQTASNIQTGMVQLEKLLPGVSSLILQDMLAKLHTCTDDSLQGAKAAAAALHSNGGQAGQGQSSRTLPRMSVLGEFLLGKWQEEEAHERALLARAERVLKKT